MSGAALEAPGVSLSANHLIALRHVALATKASEGLAALPGGFATRRKGRGLDVADVREYVRGDDLRHLDRGATARTGRLHVRQFLEDRDRIVLLIADFRQSMFWGISRVFRSVAAAEALALIGWTVVERGGRVGLLALTPGEPVVQPPAGRFRGMLNAIGGLVEAHRYGLELMAGRAHRDEQALDVAMAQAERLTPPGAEVVLASGFDNPGRALGDRLGQLARRRTPRLVLITDAESERLPDGHYPISLPDGRRARVYLGHQHARKTNRDTRVAGRLALKLDAGDPVKETAGRIAEAFRTEAVP